MVGYSGLTRSLELTEVTALDVAGGTSVDVTSDTTLCVAGL